MNVIASEIWSYLGGDEVSFLSSVYAGQVGTPLATDVTGTVPVQVDLSAHSAQVVLQASKCRPHCAVNCNQ